MNKRINTVLMASVLMAATASQRATAQQYHVNSNAHSHNDYLQQQPFYLAHAHHFYSIEMDLFMKGDQLLVAHTPEEITANRTIEALYIEPLLREIRMNGGKPYANGDKLQFLIDLKNGSDTALRLLEKKLKPIRQHFDVAANPNAVRLVISGDMPAPARFADFDPIFFFDGRAGVNYTKAQLERIAFVSAPFQRYTVWNGLGRIVEQEYQQVKHFVDSVHTAGKQVRFWGAPDTKTTWQAFIKLGVDYLNTDMPGDMARFLNTYPDNTYTAPEKHIPYKPSYKTDVSGKKPKNVILLISDGAGFSQLWAAATANGGHLNATAFRHIGFSKTNPADDYNTDSAAGATAMGTGQKTRNRYIGMDTLGMPILNVVDKLAVKGIKSGIVSNDRVTGATPSSFYAHQVERNDADKIANDLLKSQVTLLVGGKQTTFDANDGQLNKALKQQGFNIQEGIGTAAFSGKRLLCFDHDKPAENFRLIENAFDKSISYLQEQSKGKGFFLMMEGAKIDGGGHGNKIKQCIDEYLSFDKVIGKAMEFADKDGETLVLVTSDHETGGLILYDGNYQTGMVTGTFTTTDHTGLPVPLLGYGPGAEQFAGFVPNNEIAVKIVEMLVK
ncbi:alkaline phosphatase [Chitinophaga rhizophila]|uniref:Alkaline phosphatase n=1 Tax=Chitinophaga rhizophila TaxID=2866212 RepID=A0ABS7G5T5_9BACT|nr:alkaline phosphatase [Chitinophaga rhizophila]MBW8683005.1 alkaline phosphatase [Chitinophaga rhizophila]